jgi:hypothetical protein
MKTREQLITSMCYTWRHDYGIVKDPAHKDRPGMTDFIDTISAGMYQQERESLYRQMAQIFDNDIAPHMEFKTVATSRNTCGND